MRITVAAGYADGMCELSNALHAYLKANRWPPRSTRLVPFVVEAIAPVAAVSREQTQTILVEEWVTDKSRDS